MDSKIVQYECANCGADFTGIACKTACPCCGLKPECGDHCEIQRPAQRTAPRPTIFSIPADGVRPYRKNA